MLSNFDLIVAAYVSFRMLEVFISPEKRSLGVRIASWISATIVLVFSATVLITWAIKMFLDAV
jgi:hypothetical protein